MNPAGASPFPDKAWSQSRLVKALPASTTNMTGFLIIRRGSSFLTASIIARW